MKRQRILTVLVGICLILTLAAMSLMSACAPKATPEKPMVLDYATWLPPAVPFADQLTGFFEGLEDATGSTVRTELHWSGVMGKATDIYPMTVDGICDIGHIGTGYIPGVFPMFSIFEQPIQFPTAEVLTRAMIELYRKGYFDKEFADVKVIGTFCLSPYVIYSAKRKVTSVEDFEGLKVRCATPGLVEMTKALGGVPVATPSSEVYLQMQKGIVDADCNPFDAVFVYKLNEVSKYVNEMRIFTFNYIIGMNKDTWEALPKEGKEYIETN